MKTTYRKRLTKYHYTIAEMMMVVAIFMIIMSMATAAWLNSGSEAKLKRAVRLVTNQLNLARSKAIAERAEVGVYFDFLQDTSRNQKCEIFYYDGDPTTASNRKTVPGEPVLTFPNGTMAIWNKLPSATADISPYTAPTYIVFNAKGQIARYSHMQTGTDYDRYHEPLRSIFVTLFDKQKNNSLKIKYQESYYEVAVNEFNGRTKTIYHEVND